MRPPTAAEVAGFARVVADVLVEHPETLQRLLDDGLRLSGTGRGRSVLCASCGALLVVCEGNDETAARRLAATNALRNPCCERWERVRDGRA